MKRLTPIASIVGTRARFSNAICAGNRGAKNALLPACTLTIAISARPAMRSAGKTNVMVVSNGIAISAIMIMLRPLAKSSRSEFGDGMKPLTRQSIIKRHYFDDVQRQSRAWPHPPLFCGEALA